MPTQISSTIGVSQVISHPPEGVLMAENQAAADAAYDAIMVSGIADRKAQSRGFSHRLPVEITISRAPRRFVDALGLEGPSVCA
jgi:hypothetical protein